MRLEKTDADGNLDAISEGYDRFWEHLLTQEDYWAHRPRTLRRRALEFIPKDARTILDLGCGNGEAMKALSNRGILLCGIDISSKALEKARGSGEVLKGDVTRIPIRDGAFDCVLVLDVFEHVIDKRDLMKEIHRILNDSGTAIMTIPLPQATDGQGDSRQPYDKPIRYSEMIEMSANLFKVERSVGSSWMPLLPRRLEPLIPISIGFALFKSFPGLIERSETVLLILRKLV